MTRPTFPLFGTPQPLSPEEVLTGISDTILQEVNRAAFHGEGEPETVRFTVDLPDGLNDLLQALSLAVGTSRRALASRLLGAAVVEAVATLQAAAKENPSGPTALVFENYQYELSELRSKPEESDR